MKLFFKLLGNVFVVIGSCINAFGIMLSFLGKDTMSAVIGGGIFIALGVSIIVMNKKGYSW